MACTVGVCKQRVVKASMSCSVFLTGLLRLTTGLLLPDRPTDGPVISAVIFFQLIGHVPVFSEPFLIFSGVNACVNGPSIALRNSNLVICLQIAGHIPPWLLHKTS